MTKISGQNSFLNPNLQYDFLSKKNGFNEGVKKADGKLATRESLPLKKRITRDFEKQDEAVNPVKQAKISRQNGSGERTQKKDRIAVIMDNALLIQSISTVAEREEVVSQLTKKGGGKKSSVSYYISNLINGPEKSKVAFALTKDISSDQKDIERQINILETATGCQRPAAQNTLNFFRRFQVEACPDAKDIFEAAITLTDMPLQKRTMAESNEDVKSE